MAITIPEDKHVMAFKLSFGENTHGMFTGNNKNLININRVIIDTKRMHLHSIKNRELSETLNLHPGEEI